jgi:NADP-dependent 3-hydroxy acid dehydrogenase YdfG
MKQYNPNIYFLAVRDDVKGRETVAKIKNATHNNFVDYFCVELSSLKSVRNFVEEYKKRTDNKKIDIFIQNAGVMVRNRSGSPIILL